MNKTIELINKSEINVSGIGIGMIISWSIISSAELFSSSGLGGFLLFGIPFVVSILSIGVYSISRLIIKKYNWIISLVAIIYQLYFAIDYYLK